MTNGEPPFEPIAAPPPTGNPSFDAAMLAAVETFNEASLQSATQVARDDIDASKRANQVLIFLAAVTVLSGLTLIASLFFLKNPNGYVASITSGVTLVAALITGLVAKPLQIIERSTVFRRWSDTIRSVYLTSVANSGAELPEIVAAGTAATTQFGLLAASYISLASKDSAGLVTETASVPASPPSSPATAVPLALTNPGPQRSSVAKQIDPLKVSATGPVDLSLTEAGAPPGLFFSAATATFSGTPETTGTYTVTLTATSNSDPKSAVVATFDWTIQAAN